MFNSRNTERSNGLSIVLKVSWNAVLPDDSNFFFQLNGDLMLTKSNNTSNLSHILNVANLSTAYLRRGFYVKFPPTYQDWLLYPAIMLTDAMEFFGSFKQFYAQILDA